MTGKIARSLARVVLCLCVLCTSQPAWSQVNDFGRGNLQLKEAKILYDNLQYRDALKKLKTAIRVKGTTRKDIVEIYKYMGSIYIVQGQKKYAVRAFELLLKVSPNYEMNPLLTSPKILNFFNKVKQGIQKRDKVIMRHTPIQEISAAERIEVKAYVVDIHSRLRRMQVYYRRRGDPEYSTVQMRPAKAAGREAGARTYVGSIPFIWHLTDEVEMFIDYYIAGSDAKGRWVANMGNPKQPATFRINLMAGKVPEGARSTPVLKSWWFWTLVGVGLAGIGAGTYFGVTAGGGRSQPTTGQAVLVIR
ncbi:MAG TPA: tetratricopeptide repeat protein [Myxococcota bacterium]|nr:tetratricopeptide repeat protein [Myxococcota bacterium]